VLTRGLVDPEPPVLSRILQREDDTAFGTATVVQCGCHGDDLRPVVAAEPTLASDRALHRGALAFQKLAKPLGVGEDFVGVGSEKTTVRSVEQNLGGRIHVTYLAVSGQDDDGIPQTGQHHLSVGTERRTGFAVTGGHCDVAFLAAVPANRASGTQGC